MATIPTYDVPTQQLRPLPDGSVQSLASPTLLDAGGAAQMKTGVALAGGGALLTDVAAKMQERENADMVFRQETAVQEAYLKFQEDVRTNRTGTAAAGITKDANDWWAKTSADAADGLGNDTQRHLFAKRTEPMRQQSMSAMSHFEAGETEKAHDQSWQANKITNISTAVAAGTPDAVDLARERINQSNQYQNDRKHWGPGVLEAANLADTTVLHTQMIQQLAQTSPVSAAAYFEKFKGEIDGTKHAELSKYTKQVAADSIGTAATDMVWKKDGPGGDLNAPINESKMADALRDQLKDNPPALKAALADLSDRVGRHNRTQSEFKASNVGTVMEIMRKGGNWKSSPEFSALPGDVKKTIEEHDSDRRHVLYARSIQERQLREVDIERKYDGAYRMYRDPDVISTMSRNELAALEPLIGRLNTDKLVTLKDGFTKHPEKLKEAKIDNDLFNTIVSDFGIDPKKKLDLKTDDGNNQSNRINAMRNAMESEISLKQQALKRDLTREEKEEVARSAIAAQLVVPGKHWWNGDSTIPAIAATAKDLEKISVPDTARAEIINSYVTKKGQVPDDALIKQIWLAGQRKKGSK